MLLSKEKKATKKKERKRKRQICKADINISFKYQRIV